jgi:hypothetical protein
LGDDTGLTSATHSECTKTGYQDKSLCGHRVVRENKEDQRTTLKRAITKEIAAVNLKIQDLQKLAEDRDAWKPMTSALCAKLDTRER